MNNVPLIFGEVLFDCFEDGATVLGGAPFNVAWHLQAFGCSPLFVSRVGNDALGRQIESAMQQWGMSTVALQHDPDHATGEVQVSIKDGEPSYDIVPQRAFDFIQADAIPACQPALIYHGSLGLRCSESAKALTGILHSNPEAPVFMDVNLRPPWWQKEQVKQCLDAATWVKINGDELEMLVDSNGDLEKKAALLQQTHNLELVIVTQGEQGAFAMDASANVFSVQPAKLSQVVDTVGAGDAFASICILGLLKKWELETILARAQAFASALVEQQGATVHSQDFYQSFKLQWQLPNYK